MSARLTAAGAKISAEAGLRRAAGGRTMVHLLLITRILPVEPEAEFPTRIKILRVMNTYPYSTIAYSMGYTEQRSAIVAGDLTT